MAQFNNTTNAEFIPTIIAQMALGRLPAYMDIAKNVSRDSDFATASFGQVINVPKRGALSVNTKTAGSTYTVQAPTATSVSVTLNQHKEVTISIDDVTKVLENQDTLRGYAEDAAIALAEALETAVLNQHSSITNTSTFDATSTATKVSSLLNIRKFFVDQKNPVSIVKHLYVCPTFFNELLEESTFTTAQNIGSAEGLKDARILRLYGLEIHESQLVPTSGSPVAYHNVAYTRNGFVIATRPLPTPMGFGGVSAVQSSPEVGIALRSKLWYDPDYAEHKLSLDMLYGVAILDDRCVCEVESF